MKPKHIIRALDDNLKWLETHDRLTGKAEYDWQAENILVGCIQILWQCCVPAFAAWFSGWLMRKPYRLRTLRSVRKSWATRHGKRTLRDLIRWTISAVESATWVKSYWVGALPIKERRPRKPATDAQLEALAEGRKRRHDSGVYPEPRPRIGTSG